MLYADFAGFPLLCTGAAALDAAIDFLSRDAAVLPDGRHDLSGGMFAEIRCYQPAPYDERRWECHTRHIDIHCVLEGEEMVYSRPLRGMAVTEDHLTERDVAFLAEPEGKGSPLLLAPGFFAVLFPDDAHKSECRTHCETGRKVVVKIPREALA